MTDHDFLTSPEFLNEPVFDLNIIGAGPTGLFATFYAGLRGMSVQIIDSLEESGGQCTAMYPEKYIYDVIGYPKVLAKDFAAACLEQAMKADPTIRLSEQVQTMHQLEDGTFALVTSKGIRRSRAISSLPVSVRSSPPVSPRKAWRLWKARAFTTSPSTSKTSATRTW